MFNAKQLTEEQTQALHQCAADGGSMSDIQRLLKDQFGISITYMDTRFLVLDLGIQLIEEKPAEPAQEEPKLAPSPTGKVTATLDSITRPGALVSGTVTFSDGEKAIWVLDQAGRPGLDPDTPGYRPSQQDIIEFQTQLRDLIQKSGF